MNATLFELTVKHELKQLERIAERRRLRDEARYEIAAPRAGAIRRMIDAIRGSDTPAV
jgi:hypothetical protein